MIDSKPIVIATALLTIGMTLPAVAGSPGVELLEEEATKEVNIQASQDILEEISEHPGFEATYLWYEIGWIGGELDLVKYHELKVRPDVTVEDAAQWKILCHANGNDNKGCDGGDDGGDDGGSSDPRVADQTPYGIEQIYDDSTITATSGGAGVVLGHIDTGIDADHLDLQNRVVFADADDKNGHGTHTAGTAAADAGSDDLGIYGVASEASIRSYKVCNMFCSTTDINAAIQDCTNNGNRKCDVITFSIGGDSESTSTSSAIQAFVDAGGIFVAAAGNDGPSIGSIDFPAALETTIAVAAIDDTKTVADFSSRGDDDGNCGTTRHDVDLAAAGVSVMSTEPGDSYGTKSGTSMATPHVAGLALKEWGGDGATTESNIKSLVEDITKGQDATTGCDPASGLGLPHVG